MANLDWRSFEPRINALSPRERIITLLFLATVMLGTWDALFLSSSLTESRRLSAQADDLKHTVSRIDEQMAPLQAELAADDDKGLREEIAALTTRREGLDREIAAASSQLVTSANMNDVLGALVRERPGLLLHALRTLPVKAVNLGTEAAPMLLYEHGVELTISGSFSVIRDYLRDIEEREARLVWNRLDFTRTDADSGTVKLVVKTLGRDQAFIEVNR